ncbi:hypothetical protein QA601_16645 [Chitinispirillales bacterium ANBcel5]|nr:hypothetical protein [Chitinispirillales bacterium ANBcel5]
MDPEAEYHEGNFRYNPKHFIEDSTISSVKDHMTYLRLAAEKYSDS